MKHKSFIRATLVVSFLLFLFSWWFVIAVDQASFFSLMTEENGAYTLRFIHRLFGVGESPPAYINLALWKETLPLVLDTLQMSILAIVLSGTAALLLLIPGSRASFNGTLTLRPRKRSWLLYGLTQFSFLLSRAIPELIWAMLVLFVFKPGILPGALALAIHNFGILGKLFAEAAEDMDPRPAQTLTLCGASSLQVFWHAVVPLLLPKLVTYLVYRWEVILRTTIVVGFVGAGGLGHQFRLSMSYFHYSQVLLILLVYLTLVRLADGISNCMRSAA